MARAAVYYCAEDADLDTLAEELPGHGLALVRDADRLHVEWSFKGRAHRYTITRTVGPEVAALAGSLCDDREHEERLTRCDGRFEIDIGDLEVALDEINTLIVVEHGILEVTKGFLHTPWNDRFVRWSEF